MEGLESSLKLEDVEDYVACFKGIYLDRDKLSKIVRGFEANVYNGEKGEISFDAFGKRYRINSIEDYVHRRGEGGEFVYRTFLNHDGGGLLFSRHFCSYITSSDDSVDFPDSEEKETFILKEDELTREIWEKVFGGRFY